MSGLRATQASISLVGSNVANAETPGYVRKTAIQVAGARVVDGMFPAPMKIRRENQKAGEGPQNVIGARGLEKRAMPTIVGDDEDTH